MKCPICTVDLMMSERQGIEIDYCPKCRGVWLDRGELDKLIERAGDGDSGSGSDRGRREYEQRRGPDDSHHGYEYKKKKSWLGELFD
jgi:Zn-finger nucleic acid-binding protein